MRDLPVKAAGQASVPDRLIHAGVAAQDLDLVLEFHELIMAALRMHFAAAGFRRCIKQRGKLRDVEDVKAAHAGAFSRG